MPLSAWPCFWGRGAELTSSSLSLPVPLHCVLQAYGFMVYHTQLPWDVPDPATLGAPPHSICDRGYVMLQKVRLWEHTSPGDSAPEGSGTRWQWGCAMTGPWGQSGCQKPYSAFAGWLLGPNLPPLGTELPWLWWGWQQDALCLLAVLGVVGSEHGPAALTLWLRSTREHWSGTGRQRCM